MAAIRNLFTDEDLNGECFIIGSQGEIEENIIEDNVVFAPGRPNIWVNGMRLADVPNTARDECNEWLHACMIANIDHLHTHVATLPDITVARIAYYRVLAIREGYLYFDDPHELHHCRYSLRIQLPNTWIAPDDTTRVARSYALLNDADRAQMRRNFLNAVCTVAYIFRIRAHHWAENLDTKYRDTWKKVMAPDTNETPLIDWRYFARNAIHAIYPDTLDAIWTDAVKNGKCRRPLALRYHSACAGMAGVKALRAGLDDLKGGMPKIAEILEPHEKELISIEQQIEGKRWAGSVNHNFYGQPGVVFEESKLGAAASFVLHSLEVLSNGAPLANSPALRRIANQAPITGAIFSNYLIQAAKRPEVLANLMVAAPSE